MSTHFAIAAAGLARRCARWAAACVLAWSGWLVVVLGAHAFAAQERSEVAPSQQPTNSAAGAKAKGAPSAPKGGLDLERARQRWQQLTPQQRDELRQRFEHFRKLDEGERARLRGRFERLGDVKRRALEALPEPVRRELDTLAPPQRGEVLREVAAERMSEHVHDVVAMMPEHVRQEFAAADGPRRAEMVREFGRMLHERARQELFRLGRELDLPRERVEALERLEPRELGREVLELRRQSIERAIAERGLPPFVSEQQWAEIRELRGPEFMRRWGALHGHRGPLDGPRAGETDMPSGAPRDGARGGHPGPPPGADPGAHPGAPFGGHGGGRGGAAPGGDRRRAGPTGADAEAGPEAKPDAPNGPRAERDPADPRTRRELHNSARGRRLRELRDQTRPDPSWFVELSKVESDERQRVIAERVRERALKFLERAPELIDAAQLERLRSATGHEFHERLREHFPDLGEPGFLRAGRGRGGPPPWRGDGRPLEPGGGPRNPAEPARPGDGAAPNSPPRRAPQQRSGR